MSEHPDERILVIGHINPDTDSAVSAVVYAQLCNHLNPNVAHEGVVLGPLNQQTAWLFEQSQTTPPRLITSVHPTVRTITNRSVPTIQISDPLGDAMTLINRDRMSTIPVLSENRQLEGILSDRIPECNYFHTFNTEDFLGILFSFDDLIRTFGLETWQAATRDATGSLSLDAHDADEGDVVLSGVNQDALTVARDRGAAAIVLCHHQDRMNWEASLRSTPELGVYHYNGSLMAITSQLSHCIPARSAMSQHFTSLHPDQRVSEVQSEIRTSPYAIPVVESDGSFLGLVSRAELLSEKRPQVILVDHFEAHQAVPGLEEAEIVEIVDHHRVGNLETKMPLLVDCRPLGSTATIICQRFRNENVTISPSQAKLLLGAIASDTLSLNSPTTTDIDREAAAHLAQVAHLDLEAFGKEVLIQADSTRHESPAALVNKDLKEFGFGKVRFSVSQVETVDRSALSADDLAGLSKALQAVRKERSLGFSCLLVTDVFRHDSLVIIDDPDPARRTQLVGEDTTEPTLWKDCVSRKKQFLPAILSRLAGNNDAS